MISEVFSRFGFNGTKFVFINEHSVFLTGFILILHGSVDC